MKGVQEKKLSERNNILNKIKRGKVREREIERETNRVRRRKREESNSEIS